LAALSGSSVIRYPLIGCLINKLLLLLLWVLFCRRAYCRVSDSWRGNLLVQGLRNVADNISHKVGDARYGLL
jgi:hypothetical protein